MHAQIDQLIFSYDIQVFPFSMEHALTLKEPQIEMTSLMDMPDASSEAQLSFTKRFLKHPLTIDKGSFQQVREGVSPAIYFSCHVTDEQTAEICFSKGPLDEKEVLIELSMQEEEVFAKIGLEKMSLPWVSSIYSFWKSEEENRWVFTEGTLKGNIELCLTKTEEIKQLYYDLEVDTLFCIDQKLGLSYLAKKFFLKEHFSSPREFVVFNKIWPNFLGDGNLYGGEIISKDWRLSEIEGNLRFDHNCYPVIDLQGYWVKGETRYPFDFYGKGTILSPLSWQIECDWHMIKKEMPEMSTYFSILSPEPQKYVFKADIANASVDQMTLIQDIIALHYEPAQSISVSEGVISGSVHAYREFGKLQKIEIENIKAKHVKWEFSDDQIAGTLDKLHGNIYLQLDVPSPFEQSIFDVTIQNAAFDLGPNSQFSDLNLNLSIHDKYIEESFLEGYFGKMYGRLDFDGFFSNIDLKMHVDTSTEDLFAQMGKSTTPCLNLLEKQDLNLSAILSHVGPRWLFDGKLEINPEEEQKDLLTFGLRMEEKIFLEERFSIDGFKAACRTGYFQTKELSSSSCNLLLRLLNKEWEIQGEMDVDGRFDDKQLEFIVHPHNALFKSAYFDAMLDDGELFSKKEYKTFRYDIKNNHWTARIPLIQAKCHENLIGLDFEALDAMVIIDGEKIHVDNIMAFSKGVYFEGELIVDYVSPKEVNLDLQASAIRGSSENVQTFFRQFDSFSNFHFPLKGKIISGPKGLRLKTNLEGSQIPNWQIQLLLEEGQYELTPHIRLDDLTCAMSWDSVCRDLEISEMLGTLLLNGASQPQDYRINSSYIKISSSRPWDFDLRIETPTYDVLRCIGSITKEVHDGGIDIVFNQDQLNFYGSKFAINKCQFDRNWNLENVALETTISSYDLVNYISFFNQCGTLPLKSSLVEDLRSERVDGEIMLSFLYEDQGKEVTLEATSSNLQIGEASMAPLHLHAMRHGNTWELQNFQVNTLHATASIEKLQGIWNLSQINIDHKHSFLKGVSGVYNKETEKFTLQLEKITVDLEEMQPIFHQIKEGDYSYMQGTALLDGRLRIDCAKGIKNWKLESDLNFSTQNLGKGELFAETTHPFSLEYSLQECLRVKNMQLQVSQKSCDQLWANCSALDINYSFAKNSWNGLGVKVQVPPEMVMYLAGASMIPGLESRDGKLLIENQAIVWDNQIEAVFAFTTAPDFSITGTIKDGYYWLGGRSFFMEQFQFHYLNDYLGTNCKMNFREIPFDVSAKFTFDQTFSSEVEIREENAAEKEECLAIKTVFTKQEGMYIQSIEGEVCGLDFSFHHHPQKAHAREMVLSGKLKINAPNLAPLLSSDASQMIKQCDIGSGYVVSGDLILSKEEICNSYFKGFLKGRDFELMGSAMKTLQSNIYINSFQVALSDFKISDEAGMSTINEVKFEQFDIDKWNVYIPEIHLQDFRPSLLKKIGTYRGRIRPLVIEELYFKNIRGIVGDASSFKGKGELSFHNTFKRNYNIFDLPIEIIARLGLDPGIMIPIHGRLEYKIHDGKIHLTELRDSYSEGKRSHFYLSPSYISFIDFDGSVHINIKMKQHVLLKFTEPFTLSIQGNLSQPKFSLKQ